MLQNTIYFKNIKKNKQKARITYSIEIPIKLNIFNGLSIFTYIKYIKSNTCVNKNTYFKFNDSFITHTTLKHSLTLNTNYMPNINIQDTYFLKNLLIKYDIGELYFKNIICDKNLISHTYHKNIEINKETYSFSNSIYLNKNNIIITQLQKEYITIFSYYSYWKHQYYSKHLFNFYIGFYKKKNININFTKLKDITSGLLSIEIIFEAKTLLNKYLIPSTLSVLNNISLKYEENTLNYIWFYTLYTIKNKSLVFFSDITTYPIISYEHKTSIILPNNILTSGQYSVNNLILKIFSHNLSYYSQEQAIKISFLYIFNLIVESLVKQYFKNGIIIPSIQFELLVKKMTSFVKINYIGDSSFTENDILEFSILESLNYIYIKLGYLQLLFFPIVLGVSKNILASAGLLASISFQEILKYLMKVSIETTTDWLTDFKSKIITTDLIRTGSGWYRHFIKL